MRVKIAGQIGFCFGVKRAIKIAEKTLSRKDTYRKDVYSLGPIIHNPQVVKLLEEKGLRLIKSIAGLNKGTVIICSHGAPEDIIEEIKSKKIRLVDATCPFVKYAQDIARSLKNQGYRIVVIGDKKHPEVKALLSIAGKQVKGKKIGIISQTTQNKDNYLKEIQNILRDDFIEVRIFNTICSDTSRRQALTRKLLDECDVVIVVGGKNSANTRRLWQICEESGVNSYHIETGSELKKEYFYNKRCAGVVSGASTPDETVKKVVSRITKLTKYK